MRLRVSRPAVLVRGFTILLLSFAVSGCYLVRQGTYLVSYNLKTRPIGKVRTDPGTPESVRRFLERVEDVRLFAEQGLGLKRTGNYSRYVDIGKNYLADVVSASKKTSFEQYLWKFPFFGSFPYLGYFRRADAETEAARLRKKNLDVLIRKVDAFSTLGIFSDPVFSFMADYAPYDIANLIIHEDTHATVFLKNRIAFNEQLATFIGDEGALLYVRTTFGEDSPEYRDTLVKIREDKAFVDFLRSEYKALDAMYSLPITDAEKLQRKAEIIERFRKRFSDTYDTMFSTDNYRGFERINVNNAYLAVYATYTADLGEFRKFHEAMGSDLRKTIRELLAIKSWKGDPYEFLRERSNR